MVDESLKEFGKLDILVCNAGVASRGLPVSDTDPTEAARLLATHAVGPHHLRRLVIPSMRTRPRGDIVMVSSAATTVAEQSRWAIGAPVAGSISCE